MTSNKLGKEDILTRSGLCIFIVIDTRKMRTETSQNVGEESHQLERTFMALHLTVQPGSTNSPFDAARIDPANRRSMIPTATRCVRMLERLDPNLRTVSNNIVQTNKCW